MEVGGVGFRVEVPEPDSGEGDEGEVDRVGVGPVLHVGQVAWRRRRVSDRWFASEKGFFRDWGAWQKKCLRPERVQGSLALLMT